MAKNKSDRSRWNIWALSFVLATLAISTLAYLHYAFETDRIRNQRYDEISAIAELKSGAIQAWRKNLLDSVVALANAPLWKRTLNHLFESPENALHSGLLGDQLRFAWNHGGHQEAILLGTDGNVILSATNLANPVHPSEKKALLEALSSTSPQIVDIYRSPDNDLLIGAIAPITDSKGKPVAAVLFRVDAKTALYPYLQTWPASSDSAETVLIRRKHEEVEFINDLRHRPDAALALTNPVSSSDLPAAQALNGKTGLFQGKDYRGVEVLADLRPIPDSPWFMITKVDTNEIMAEAKYRWSVIIIFCSLLILHAAGLTAYLYRNTQARLFESLYQKEREQREAEEALRKSEDKFSRAFRHAPVIMTLSVLEDGTFVDVNDAFCEISGFNREECIGKTSIEIGWISAQVRTGLISQLQRNGRITGMDQTFFAKNKQELTCIYSGELIQTGNTVMLLSIALDITERKRVEKELLQSEDKFSRVFQQAPILITLSNATDSTYFDVNKKVCEVSGFSREEIIGKTDAELGWISVEDLRRIGREIESKGRAHETELKLFTKDGRSIYVIFNGELIQTKDGPMLLSIAQDITDRKLSEEQIRLNELRLQSLYEISQYRANSSQELLDFTLEHAIRLTGSQVGYIYHYEEENRRFILNTWSRDVMKQCEVAEPETVYELEKTGLWGEAVRQRRFIMVNDFQSDNQFKKGYPEGHVELFNFLTAPIFFGERIVAVVGVGNKKSDYDESDVRQLTLLMDSVWRMIESQRVALRDRLLSAAIDQIAEGVVITDSKAIIQYVNPAAEVISGYDSKELIGQGASIFRSDKNDDSLYTNMWATIKAGDFWSGRFVNRKKDGTEYYEDNSISPIFDETGKLTNYVAIKHDVTKHVKLKEQLFQAQKLEAVAILAGGVAHDFNNLLQAVLGYSELMLQRRSHDDPDYEDLSKIHSAGKRGAELVRSLMTFSRKMEPNYVAVDLNQEVIAARDLLFRTIPKNINIDLRLQGNLPSVRADSSQIGQILMNLGVNARDAMPQGGTLGIQTEMIELDNEYCNSNSGLKPGPYVLMKISDNGQGMDGETVSHMFEPFFTTKEPGKGTGLGLATVYGILKQHDAQITCYSEPGRGTTFRIYFPIVSEKIRPAPPKDDTEIRGGSETILLVDDEQTVRDIGKKILDAHGYSVITANDGMQALEIYSDRGAAIDLIILDYVMPVMDGVNCTKKIKEINPTTKILLTSGHSVSSLDDVYIQTHANGFIEKPFNANHLLTKIRQVLD